MNVSMNSVWIISELSDLNDAFKLNSIRNVAANKHNSYQHIWIANSLMNVYSSVGNFSSESKVRINWQKNASVKCNLLSEFISRTNYIPIPIQQTNGIVIQHALYSNQILHSITLIKLYFINATMEYCKTREI